MRAFPYHSNVGWVENRRMGWLVVFSRQRCGLRFRREARLPDAPYRRCCSGPSWVEADTKLALSSLPSSASRSRLEECRIRRGEFKNGQFFVFPRYLRRKKVWTLQQMWMSVVYQIGDVLVDFQFHFLRTFEKLPRSQWDSVELGDLVNFPRKGK